MSRLLVVGCAAAVLSVVAPVSAQSGDAKSESKSILVVASKIKDLPDDHYLWAAEMAAGRLKGNTKVLAGGLASALRYARENSPSVTGIVEIMVDVYTLREEVRITCFDPRGKQLWKEKAVANMGGSEESLARRMVERALNKTNARPACGGR